MAQLEELLLISLCRLQEKVISGVEDSFKIFPGLHRSSPGNNIPTRLCRLRVSMTVLCEKHEKY